MYREKRLYIVKIRENVLSTKYVLFYLSCLNLFGVAIQWNVNTTATLGTVRKYKIVFAFTVIINIAHSEV